MAYVVLARKYRPQTFDEVIGQEAIATTLKNAIASNRVAHAYLFAGSRGVGKTSMARIMAKALNCANGPTAKPCNDCSICKSINTGDNVDVIEIDGASNRGIDEIRNLRENVKYAPIQARFKIYIVDEVHMLTTPAFNALLKTLEEPPAHVKFIFATTEPNKLPETVLSRCQRFDFKNISTDDIVKRLNQITSSEKIDIEDASLAKIARKANGGMRDSQSLLDKLISFAGTTISSDDVDRILGFVSIEAIFTLLENIIHGDIDAVITNIDTVYKEGKSVEDFLDEMVKFLRDVLIAKCCKNHTHLIERNKETLERLAQLAGKLSQDTIIYFIKILTELAKDIRGKTQTRVPVEITFVKLARMEDLSCIEDLLDQIDALTDKIARAGTATLTRKAPQKSLFDTTGHTASSSSAAAEHTAEHTEPQPADEDAANDAVVTDSHVETGGVDIDSIKRRWNGIINKLPLGMSIKASLHGFMPIAFDGTTLTLAGNQTSHFHNSFTENGTKVAEAERGLTKVLGGAVRLAFSEAGPIDATGITTATESKKNDGQKKSSDPLINFALDLFNGTILQKEVNNVQGYGKYEQSPETSPEDAKGDGTNPTGT